MCNYTVGCPSDVEASLSSLVPVKVFSSGSFSTPPSPLGLNVRDLKLNFRKLKIIF